MFMIDITQVHGLLKENETINIVKILAGKENVYQEAKRLSVGNETYKVTWYMFEAIGPHNRQPFKWSCIAREVISP